MAVLNFNLLNADQYKAATSEINSHLLIIAPPGSGKTTTLANRVSYLLSTGIPPSQILLLTFTNKAASEIKSRIKSLITADIKNLTIGTFHKLGLKILRKYPFKSNLPYNFKVISGNALGKLVVEVINDFLQENKFSELEGQEGLSEEELNEQIDFIQSTTVSLSDIKYLVGLVSRAKVDKLFMQGLPKAFFRFFCAYNKKLQENSCIDFSDMLYLPYTTLEVYRDILRNYQSLYKYILVDEFQDCNQIQISLLKLIGGKAKITVCGDDDQCIYSWLGISQSIFTDFEAEFKPIKVVLSENYRSTPTIISHFTSLIRFNENRVDKEITTKNPDGPEVHFVECRYPKEEINFLIEKIKELVKNQQAEYKEIAILFRLNRIFQEIFGVLKTAGLPVRKIRKNNFDMNESKVICYLKAGLDQNDNKSLKKILNFPKRKIGKKILKKIQENDVYNSVLANLKVPALNKFFQVMEALKADIDVYTPYEVIQRLLEKLKILAPSLLANSEKYSGVGREGLSYFLSDIGENPGNFITLSNIHQAKGKEWDAVFVIRMNEKVLPLSKSLLEEERRLAYVACSRSRKHLYVSCVKSPGYKMYPSLFVEELQSINFKRKSEYIETKSGSN